MSIYIIHNNIIYKFEFLYLYFRDYTYFRIYVVSVSLYVHGLYTTTLTCIVMMYVYHLTSFLLDHCPFSTGNSNTISSSSFCLSWHNSFVLSWSGTLPLWRGVPEVPDFCGTSIPKLVFNFNLISSYVLAASCQIVKCCSFLKNFHKFLSSNWINLLIGMNHISSVLWNLTGVASECKGKEKCIYDFALQRYKPVFTTELRCSYLRCFLYCFTLTLIIHIIDIYIWCEIGINFHDETIISIGQEYQKQPRDCI